MRNFSQLRQEFLEQWIKGLQVCSSSSKNMGILERKNAIKLSADLAMAFARKGRTSWSRAVIAKLASQNNNNNNNNSNNDMTTIKKPSKQRILFQSKKIMKRSQKVYKGALRNKRNWSRKAVLHPNSMAKRLVQKRTRVLKRLVPGGTQCLDEVTLMRETLDYIISLRAQIDVMRCLAGATTEACRWQVRLMAVNFFI